MTLRPFPSPLALAAVGLGAVRGRCARPVPRRPPRPGRHVQARPGRMRGETVAGSYFRMIFPTAAWPTASSSTTPTPPARQDLHVGPAGRQGGLVTGTYQPNPTPALNARAARGGQHRAAAELHGDRLLHRHRQGDPQTGDHVPAPSLSVAGGKISGQLEAWSASWNKLYFNQGSPKPGGATPGLTAAGDGHLRRQDARVRPELDQSGGGRAVQWLHG